MRLGKLKLLVTDSKIGWRVLSALVIALFITAIYLFIFPAPTLTYVANVLIHAGLGGLAIVLLIPRLFHLITLNKLKENAGWLLIAAGGALGIYLVFIGTSRPNWNWMYAHIAVSFAGTALLASRWAGAKGWMNRNTAVAVVRVILFLGLAAVLGLGGWKLRQGRWLSSYKITNPAPPLSMDGEGDGPKGAFFPSSSQTAHKGRIPSTYFMESD